MVEEEDMKRDGLTKIHIAAYSVGHVFNDLIAAMFFFYMIWLMEKVLLLPNEVSAYAFAAGQMTDGISTPLIGILSDKFTTRWGSRTPWYFVGQILDGVAVVALFYTPEFIKTSSYRNTYYIMAPVVLNLGWSSVQISHMSMLNNLSNSNYKRDLLSNNKNGFTYGANILVLLLATLIFEVISNEEMQFRVLVLISAGVGILTTMFFLCAIDEPKLTREAYEYDMAYKKVINGGDKNLI